MFITPHTAGMTEIVKRWVSEDSPFINKEKPLNSLSYFSHFVDYFMNNIYIDNSREKARTTCTVHILKEQQGKNGN